MSNKRTIADDSDSDDTSDSSGEESEGVADGQRKRRRVADSDEESLEEGEEKDDDDYDDNDNSGDSDDDSDSDDSGSKSDSGSDVSNIDDGYDSEGYRDEEDRQELGEMKEVDREKILYERKERARQMLEDKKAEKYMKNLPAARRPHRRKRSRQAEETDKSLNRIKDLRQGKRTRSSDEESSSRESSPERNYYARDTHDHVTRDSPEWAQHGDGEEDKIRRGRAPVRESTECTLKSIKSCQVRRDGIFRTFEQPFFSKWITGAFIRVGIGIDLNNNNKPKYVMGEVVGVSTYHRRYKFFSKETETVLKVAHGPSIRKIKMDMISNHSITEEEFNIWKDNMLKGRESYEADPVDGRLQCIIPSHEECLTRKTTAEHLRQNYVFTSDDVKIMAQKKFKANGPIANITMGLIRLKQDLAQAREQVKANPDDSAAFEWKQTIERRISDLKAKGLDDSRKSRVRARNTANINEANRRRDAKREAYAQKDRDEITAFHRSKTRPSILRFGKAGEAEKIRIEAEIRKKRLKVKIDKKPTKVDKYAIVPTTPTTPTPNTKKEMAPVKTSDSVWSRVVGIHCSVSFDGSCVDASALASASASETGDLPKEAPRVDADWFYEKIRYEKTITLQDYRERCDLV